MLLHCRLFSSSNISWLPSKCDSWDSSMLHSMSCYVCPPFWVSTLFRLSILYLFFTWCFWVHSSCILNLPITILWFHSLSAPSYVLQFCIVVFHLLSTNIRCMMFRVLRGIWRITPIKHVSMVYCFTGTVSLPVRNFF